MSSSSLVQFDRHSSIIKQKGVELGVIATYLSLSLQMISLIRKKRLCYAARMTQEGSCCLIEYIKRGRMPSIRIFRSKHRTMCSSREWHAARFLFCQLDDLFLLPFSRDTRNDSITCSSIIVSRCSCCLSKYDTWPSTLNSVKMCITDAFALIACAEFGCQRRHRHSLFLPLSFLLLFDTPRRIPT